MLWSIVLACHGAANSFASLGALRFLLGVFEATISPGFSLITAMWYKPSEHSSRHGLWFAGNGIAGLFGGVLSYAIGHIKSGLAAWRVRVLPLLLAIRKAH
jgi:ACS family allantoate permease-like MFS transporter